MRGRSRGQNGDAILHVANMLSCRTKWVSIDVADGNCASLVAGDLRFAVNGEGDMSIDKSP